MISFERITPEQAGISSRHVLNFLERLEHKHLPMHSIQLLHRDRIFAEGYYAPYRASTPHRMFSISKSLTSLAIGFLEQEGKLSLTDPIISYFPDLVPRDVHPWIAAMTIRDMLMMRTCHASTTYKINQNGSWVESFFTTPPTHPAGQIFHYDTSSAHTLCALAERLTGRPMLDYLKEKLVDLELSPDSYMLKDPFGVSLGGSGLVCTPEDLRKLAYFIEHRGKVNGKQLLNREYLETATSCLTSTRMTAPLPSEACGYGYQFWQNQRGGYTCYGMGGQLMIFLPEYHLICITTADTQGMAGGNQLIYDALYEEILPYLEKDNLSSLTSSGEETEAFRQLTEKLKALTLPPLPTRTPREFEADSLLPASYSGTWRFLENPREFSQMILTLPPNNALPARGRLVFTIAGRECPLEFGFGELCVGEFPLYHQRYAGSGTWEDASTLTLRFQIIDAYVGSVHLQLHFEGKQITLFLKKQEESLFQEFQGHLVGQKVE